QEVISIMYKHDIQPSEAMAIYNSSNGDIEQIKKVYSYLKDKSAENFIGLMVSMVKPEVFIEPKKNEQIDSFNDYEQRDYDFKALENKLLGWDNLADEEAAALNDNNNIETEEPIDVSEIVRAVSREIEEIDDSNLKRDKNPWGKIGELPNIKAYQEQKNAAEARINENKHSSEEDRREKAYLKFFNVKQK
ncbi:MAG: hypothetical protein J0I68_00035, partial [Achromobacter sp.]|uniref:hypothetical protein n=1 Tax=Achromobacter sp. TaxID=134375 RepID=UPI001AC25178